jgi:hypothetical protein
MSATAATAPSVSDAAVMIVKHRAHAAGGEMADDDLEARVPAGRSSNTGA